MWQRLVERLEPRLVGGTYMSLLESRREMVVTTLLLAGFSTINIVISGIVLTVLHEPEAAWLAFAAGLAYTGSLAYFVITGDNVRSMRWVLITSYLNNVGVHLLLGGFANSGVSIAWGIIVCTYAVVTQPKRFTIAITSLYVVTAIVLVFFEGALSGARDAPDALVPALLAADLFIASVVMLVPALNQLLGLLAKERARSERLLLNVLPQSIATRLKTESGVIADEHTSCTVLFADIAGFTSYSRHVPAGRLVSELNEIFTVFDELSARFGVEKIKTIGDGYMAVAGAPDSRPDHVVAMCELALEMVDAFGVMMAKAGRNLGIRIGVNTGPVVAGVIGTSKFAYDLWGDTVNLASRMESAGVIGSVQVSRAVVDAVGDRYHCEPAGLKDLKGAGPTETFLLRRQVPVLDGPNQPA